MPIKIDAGNWVFWGLESGCAQWINAVNGWILSVTEWQSGASSRTYNAMLRTPSGEISLGFETKPELEAFLKDRFKLVA